LLAVCTGHLQLSILVAAAHAHARRENSAVF
jgi:hypothetical protein